MAWRIVKGGLSLVFIVIFSVMSDKLRSLPGSSSKLGEVSTYA
jgi:hypothetical protein